MSNTKIVASIIIITSIFSLFCFYSFFAARSDYELERAADEFAKESYVSAKEVLQKLQNKISETEYNLYVAYVLRETKTVESANKHLILAEKSLSEDPKAINSKTSRLALEIYLNQAYNSFLQEDTQAMDEALAKAVQIRKDHVWVLFFQAWRSFLKQEYQPALEEWQEEIQVGFLSPWMRKCFGDAFDSFWYCIHLSNAQIASGNYLEARNHLNSIRAHVSQNQLEEIYFLIGLSYLKEAEEHEPISRIPFDKEAAYYLSQGWLQLQSNKEKLHQINHVMKKQIMNLLEMRHLDDVSFYTQLMEKWNILEDSEEIRQKATVVFDLAISEKDWVSVKHISRAISPLLSKSEEREAASKKLDSCFCSVLYYGGVTDLDYVLDGMRLFSSKPSQLNQKVVNRLAAFIFQMLPLDTPDLFLTTPYFEFWMKQDNNRAELVVFAHQLIATSELFWNRKEHEKALELLKIAVTLPQTEDRAKLYTSLQILTERFYVDAESQNNTDLLNLLKKTNKYIEIKKSTTRTDSGSKLKVEDLFNAKQYDEAQLQALDNLKEDPYHRKSLKVLGLIDYYKGNYKSAKQYFYEISTPSISVLKALAISEMLTDNYAFGLELFNNINLQFSASNDDFKRLGLGFLLKNQPQESLKWLSKVTPVPPDVTAGKCLAYFALEQWAKALQEFNNLPKNYQLLPSLQRVQLESTAAMGDMNTSTQLLEALLQNTQVPEESAFSSIFLNFKKQTLDYQTPRFIAGSYYYRWKKDTHKAIEYFKGLPKTCPMTSLAIAKILTEVKKYPEAYAVLIQNYPLDGKKKMEANVMAEALPLIASLEDTLGYYLEAQIHYIQYFDLFPAQIEFRNRYAQVLMNLQHYNEALNQLLIVSNERSLYEPEQIQFLECLFHLGRWKEVENNITAYFDKQILKSLEHQLKLSKFLWWIDSKDFLKSILPKVADINPDKVSLHANIALLQLWIEIGDYSKALSVASAIQPDLEQSVDGLLTLALLEFKQNHPSEALSFVQKAKKIDPYNRSMASLTENLENSEKDLSGLKQQLIVLQKMQQTNNSSISLQLEYIKTLVEIASRKSALMDLQGISQILAPIIETYPDIPFLYYLQGHIYSITQDWKSAKESYKTAIKLDGSYVLAYTELSRVCLALHEPEEALQALNSALKFARYDSKVLYLLAHAYVEQGNLLKGIETMKQMVQSSPNTSEGYYNLAEWQLILETQI